MEIRTSATTHIYFREKAATASRDESDELDTVGLGPRFQLHECGGLKTFINADKC